MKIQFLIIIVVDLFRNLILTKTHSCIDFMYRVLSSMRSTLRNCHSLTDFEMLQLKNDNCIVK